MWFNKLDHSQFHQKNADLYTIMDKLNSTEIKLLYICSKKQIDRSGLTLKSKYLDKTARNAAIKRLLDMEFVEEIIIPSDNKGPDRKYYTILENGKNFLENLQKKVPSE